MRHFFPAMAPEPVSPSPPSNGGLLGGEEVVCYAILEVFLKGGMTQIAGAGFGKRVRIVGLLGLLRLSIGSARMFALL